jgi:hypothetical protein
MTKRPSMRVRFVQDACNVHTGNSRYKAGDFFDVREDYARALIGAGLAIDTSAPISKPELESDLESMTVAQLRQLATELDAPTPKRKADLISSIREHS